MTVQQDVAPPAPALGWRELAFTRLGQVAVGLLLVELLAAMQVFLTATLLPTVAADLGGRSWYAAAIAAGAATVFVTMPVSGPLADRLGPARVLALFAPAYVAGGVVSAAAPAMWVYVLGRAVLAVSRRLLMPGALRLRAGRPAAIGALLVLAAAYFGVDAVVVIVCRERLGASGLAAGLVLSAGALAWSLATVARERLARRLGPPAAATVRTGALLLGAGCAAMAVVAATDGPIGAFAVGWTAAGAGMGLAYPALLGAALAGSEGSSGATAASAVLAEALGAALGAVAAGALVTAALRAAGGAALLVAVFAAAAALAMVLFAASGRLAAAAAVRPDDERAVSPAA